jgi:hypothetical protein
MATRREPSRQQPRRARGTVGHPYSALNLRLALATFGLVISLVFGALVLRAGYPVPAGILFALAAVAVVDLIVIFRRRAARRREEPPGTHHSLFE